MTNLKYALIIALIALGGVIIYQHHRSLVKSQAIELYEHNSMAARDSIKYLELENGQLLAERQSYILSEEQLSVELELTKSQVRELRKKLGSAISQLSTIQSQIHTDTIYITSTVDTDDKDTTHIFFDYTDKWMKMNGLMSLSNGSTQVATTVLYNMDMNIPLTVGFTEDRRLFATSPNPYIHITDIQSVVSDRTIRKKKHWSIGLNVGPGLYYDIVNNQVGAGVGVQLGINYNF